MYPSGRITVTTETQAVSRFRLYGYGEDGRVPNEGDLLLISDSFLCEAGRIEKVELELLLRGKDLWMFSDKLQTALALYEANKAYLSQPATRQVAVARRLPAAPAVAVHGGHVIPSDPPKLIGSRVGRQGRAR